MESWSGSNCTGENGMMVANHGTGESGGARCCAVIIMRNDAEVRYRLCQSNYGRWP